MTLRARVSSGTLEDRQDPCVHEVAADRELLGVAHPAVDLHGLAGHPFGGAADVGLHHRRLERALSSGHQPGHVVRALTGRLDQHGHAAQLGPGQLVVADRGTEHLAFGRVGRRRVVRRLHDAQGPGRRLQTAVLEALHLEVEALAQPVAAPDQVGLGYEPILERELVGMHAPVTERVDGPALEPPRGEVGGPVGPPVLGEDEPLAVTAGLLHHEHGEAAVGQRAVRVGAGQQHEHVGPGGEGAPGLDPVDHPPSLDRGGRGDDPGDVGAVVGFGHRDGGQDLGRGQLGEPVLLLLLGPAVDQGPGQDLGPGDERAAHAERTPAQLLGGHHHAHVVALAPRRVPAVLLGDREPEATELGQTLDDLFGDVPVGAVHVLGVRSDLLLGETVERLADQLEVLAQVSRPFAAGQVGQHGRVALGGQELAYRLGSNPPRRPRAARGRRPCRPGRPARRPRRPLRCGPRARLGRRSRAWPRRGHGGRRVGEGIGDDLVGIDAAGGAYGGAGLVDQFLGQVDRPGCISQGGGTGCRHGARRYRLARRTSFAQARRPITVTSGGRTTGSSPGSTPVSVSR